MKMINRTKKISIGFVFSVLFFSAVQTGFAQSDLHGSEDPAVYGREKAKILAREERSRRSQTIQEVAQTYREMVSSYKAKRIIRAEELSQKLDALLDDPVLPESFALKIRHKQQRFLRRIYGDDSNMRVEVQVDDVSDEEVVQIQQVLKEGEGSPAIGQPEFLAQEMAEDSQDIDLLALRRAEKEAVKQKRFEEKERRKQEKAALKEARRQEIIARRKKRRDEYSARKEKKKAERLVRLEARRNKKNIKDGFAGAGEGSELETKPVAAIEQNIDAVAKDMDDAQLAKRREVQTEKLLEYQKEFLDLERKEVDRYVRLYKEEMKEQKRSLEEEFSRRVDSLYQDGIEFFEKKAYHFSYDVLREVEELHPNYKMTRQYLAELERSFKLNLNTDVSMSSTGRLQREQLIAEFLDTYHP